MNQKRITLTILSFILALSCCSCSPKPETPEQVLEKMQAAITETPYSKAQIVMDMTMALDAGDQGVQEISTTITNDLIISQDPLSSYTSSTVDASYDGESMQTSAESYSVVEEGELVSYSHSSGIWIKLSTGQTIEELKSFTSSINIDTNNVVIDETVTELNGKPVICLTTQLSGSSMDGFLDSMLEGIGLDSSAMSEGAETVASFDFSALSCDAKIILDKETYLPISEEVLISGMSDVLAPLYSTLGMTVDITTCTATISFLSYEVQDEILLPEGASEKAAAWERLIAGDPENGDGTFTIREGSYLMDITTPEGFELEEKGYDHVYFTRDDHRQIKYTMHYGAADNFAAEIDSTLNRYGDLPKNISREQMTLEGGNFTFDCDIIGVEWSSYEEGLTYAWTELGNDGIANYYLFVEVTDGYNDGLGNSKSADMTPDEFMSYLNAGTLSELME